MRIKEKLDLVALFYNSFGALNDRFDHKRRRMGCSAVLAMAKYKWLIATSFRSDIDRGGLHWGVEIALSENDCYCLCLVMIVLICESYD